MILEFHRIPYNPAFVPLWLRKRNGVRANIGISLSLSLKIPGKFSLFWRLSTTTEFGPARKDILNEFPRAVIAQHYRLIQAAADDL